MNRALAVLTVFLAGAVCLPGQSMADQAKRFRGIVWIQPAVGVSVGDELVSGQVDANVSVSDVPLIGPIGVTLPVSADVMFEDPLGILVGGELSVMRFGLEVNVIYLPEAATVRGGVRVCGGLLTESECELLQQGNPWVPGIAVPDLLIVEESLGNVAVTVGVNYHLITDKRMAVWSVWDEYDFSDVRVDLTTSLESLVQGEVDQFDLACSSDIAPQNTLTFGANIGGRYRFAGRWSLLGQFRYFAGDDLELPDVSGRYRAAGFSVGIAHRFGG